MRSVEYIEEDAVPHDTTIVGQAWAKSNKDGSPDRRFASNYQIPIVRYGRITFATASGVAEAYQVSNWEAALAFGDAFVEVHRAMRSQSSRPGSVAAAASSEATTINLDERLPALPDVPGAHGLTVSALAIVSVAISGAVLSRQSLLQAPLTQVVAFSPSAPIKEAGSPLSNAPPFTALEPVHSQSPPIALSTSITQPLPARERLATKQGANVRSGPDRTATVLKTVGVGAIFQVFGRQRDWVQVGDESPIGWIHSSLLKPAI